MKALKSFFVWILLLALPLQGFAAASMSMCEPGPMKVAVADGHHGGPGMSGAMGCDHHKAQQPDDAKTGGMAKCSTCASCSVGAAIFTPLAPLGQFNSHGAERIPYVAAYDTGCIYGTLERPPHTLS